MSAEVDLRELPRGHGCANGRRPCDFCAEKFAPLGFAPPGGARRLKPGTRPLTICLDPECIAKARARVAEVRDVFSKPKPKQEAAPQGDLFA